MGNSLLVLGIGWLLMGSRKGLFAGLLFAVHPIHTGRVTNMTGGFDQLGILFLLGALYLYLLYSKQGKKTYLWSSLLVFVLGLLASEEAIVLFPLILLYDYCIRKNVRRKEYAWYLVISVAYLVLRFFILQIGARAEGYSPYIRFLAMDIAFVKYLWLLFVPFPLTVQRSISLESLSLISPLIFSALVLHVLLLVWAIRSRHRFPTVSYGIMWFYVALLPMSQIVPIQTIMAERYLYVASVGFCFAVVTLVYYLRKFVVDEGLQKKFASGVLWTVIILFSLLTIERNMDWRDDVTLWTDTISVSPRSTLAYNNLGFAYDRIGQYEEAIPYYQNAILIDSKNFRAYSNLGVAYIRLERYGVAVRALNQSIQLDPTYAKSHNFLSIAYQELGKPDEARDALLTAVSLDPLYYEAYNNLGILYARYGEVEGARKAFLKALEISPSYEDAAYNLQILEIEKPQ
jgi:tetratricopeptide (TPR) repeat protein